MDLEPTNGQLVLLSEIHKVFRRDSEWPTFQHLEIVLAQDHGLQANQTMQGLTPSLIRAYTPVRDDSRIAARIGGIRWCEGAEPELGLFLRALHWAVGRREDFRPKSATQTEQLNVSGQEMQQDWASVRESLSEADFAKLHEMFSAELLDISLNGSPGNWQWSIEKGILRFRTVLTIDEYVRLVDEADQAAREVPSPVLLNGMLPTTVVVQPHPRVIQAGADRLGTEDPRLMVDSLHPMVGGACSPLFENGHYRQGVLEAVLALRDMVRDKSGITNVDDNTLMGSALGGKNPRIVIADLSTETGRNTQRGSCLLAQGIVARVRNVLAHEKVELDPVESMEMVAIISRVVRDVDTGVAAATEPARAETSVAAVASTSVE